MGGISSGSYRLRKASVKCSWGKCHKKRKKTHLACRLKFSPLIDTPLLALLLETLTTTRSPLKVQRTWRRSEKKRRKSQQVRASATVERAVCLTTWRLGGRRAWHFSPCTLAPAIAVRTDPRCGVAQVADVGDPFRAVCGVVSYCPLVIVGDAAAQLRVPSCLSPSCSWLFWICLR